MYNIIAPIIIILSLAGILVIFLRRIHQASKENIFSENKEKELGAEIQGSNNQEAVAGGFNEDEEIVEETGKIAFLSEKVKKISNLVDLHKIGFFFIQLLEKNLRKLKVSLMKIENKAGELTNKLSAKAKDFGARIENNDSEKEEKIADPMVDQRPSEVIEAPKEKEVLPELDVEAEKELIYKIAKDPSNINNYLELGYLYLQVGNHNDAFESFKQVLKRSPYNRRAKVAMEKIKKIKEEEE